MAKHCDNNKGEDKPKVKFFILEIQTEILSVIPIKYIY